MKLLVFYVSYVQYISTFSLFCQLPTIHFNYLNIDYKFSITNLQIVRCLYQSSVGAFHTNPPGNFHLILKTFFEIRAEIVTSESFIFFL